MSLQGEIITAFVAALGTIATTVGLVAYLLRDLKSEFQELRTEMPSDIQELRTEMRSDIQELRTEMRSEIGSSRSEHGSEIGSVRSEIAGLRTDVRQVLIELLHHVQTGHNPPPHAA